MPRWCLALVAAATACTPAQAPYARKTGMVLSIGGVAGLIGSALAERYTDRVDDLIVGFSITSAVGIVMYAAGELSEPSITYRQEPTLVRHRRWAKILSERASGAARENRCGRVRRLERRIATYDREIHDFVLMADPEVVRCLTTSPPTSLAPGAEATRPPIVMPPVAPIVAPDAAPKDDSTEENTPPP